MEKVGGKLGSSFGQAKQCGRVLTDMWDSNVSLLISGSLADERYKQIIESSIYLLHSILVNMDSTKQGQ